jgi:hypothetical protein
LLFGRFLMELGAFSLEEFRRSALLRRGSRQRRDGSDSREDVRASRSRHHASSRRATMSRLRGQHQKRGVTQRLKDIMNREGIRVEILTTAVRRRSDKSTRRSDF